MKLKNEITSRLDLLKSLHESTPNKQFHVKFIFRIDREVHIIFHDDSNMYIDTLTINY